MAYLAGVQSGGATAAKLARVPVLALASIVTLRFSRHTETEPGSAEAPA
ncbi:MAG TPA: hypothetical protein VGN34_07710 [Ktedonobacteraceae bacterium]|jgi:hypothetical protein